MSRQRTVSLAIYVNNGSIDRGARNSGVVYDLGIWSEDQLETVQPHEGVLHSQQHYTLFYLVGMFHS